MLYIFVTDHACVYNILDSPAHACSIIYPLIVSGSVTFDPRRSRLCYWPLNYIWTLIRVTAFSSKSLRSLQCNNSHMHDKAVVTCTQREESPECFRHYEHQSNPHEKR